MAKQQPTQQALFAEKFRDDIRVGLNWDRFLREQWPVEKIVIRSVAGLKRCFVPWYIGPDGKELAYNMKDAVPMRLTDVPKAIDLLHDERTTDIKLKVREFKESTGNICFEAPTYALRRNQYFVMDRNHRLSALTMLPSRFEVTLWNIRGPFELDGLLDLYHWLSPKQRLQKATLLQKAHQDD
jgi:hypothetical protein